MFTGLIEHLGTLREIALRAGGEARLSVDLGPLAEDLHEGDSIAIDGCCLTVVRHSGQLAEFDAVPETLLRTTLGTLRSGAKVNLERALHPAKRLGGHFVQGHVDGTALVAKTVRGGRWAEWHFRLEQADLGAEIVRKGSIAVDGISLTVAGRQAPEHFWVALIPETLARTTLGAKGEGQRVNIETDILGKYVQALLHRGARAGEAASPAESTLSEAWLRERGF